MSRVLKGCICCTPRHRRQPRLMQEDRHRARCGRCRTETTWEAIGTAEASAYRQRIAKAHEAMLTFERETT